MSEPFSIACLSHLPWEERLFQRPQQLMKQFEAAGHPVLYQALMSSRRWRREPESREHPIGSRGRALNRPYMPLSGRLRFAAEISVTRMVDAVRDHFRAHPGARRVLWLQHPVMYAAIPNVEYDVLVYDIMDPFESFAASQRWIAQADDAVLTAASVVFTGGRSLHQERLGYHENLHCFPSGIDVEHFRRARGAGPLPRDLATIGEPRLVYCGAVDERIDWELLKAVCGAKPDWQVVLIGPLVGMDRAPVSAPNLHIFGGRPYGSLPDYLRGTGVALIPWRVNELTRFMSPTKTPEYLTAGCPVVSTPIPDVVADYGDRVHIAEGAQEFERACEAALEGPRPDEERPPGALTWQEIAGAMASLIRKVPDRGPGQGEE